MPVCTSCGGHLEYPADLGATESTCGYCGARAPIPSEVLAPRAAERARADRLALIQQARQTSEDAVRKARGSSLRLTLMVLAVAVLSLLLPLLFTVLR